MSDADKPASLPQLKEMAEEIAEAACDHSPDFPRFGGADFKAHVAERLAPLYAENERLRAENEATDSYVADLIREHNEDSHEQFKQRQRIAKLLEQSREYVALAKGATELSLAIEESDVRKAEIQKELDGHSDLLTRIDAETGGK